MNGKGVGAWRLVEVCTDMCSSAISVSHMEVLGGRTLQFPEKRAGVCAASCRQIN